MAQEQAALKTTVGGSAMPRHQSVPRHLSPLATPRNANQIRDDMSQSPRGASPTENRVNFLMQAKEKREMRNQRRRTLIGSPRGTEAL